MTRISRKLLSWVLGVMACVAIVFGVLVARPQTKVASAESPVTFNAAALGDAAHETYGTSIRFDTAGQTWATNHNWQSADVWKSIADYTTVNGRTVTEINNATTHTQKITLMMQPAGSFSFLRLYIPAEIMPLGDVRSMGILEGWSFDNGAATFTSPAVTFLRVGDSMVLADNYSATTKLTASDITIGDAALRNIPNPTCGTDSYSVDINIGRKIAGEYETMYGGYKQIRNAIYINGKSIEEWNTQKLAEDARFNNPASYAFFPQNSTDPSHLEPFVKPVALWSTETGFRLTIYQELLADCETVTVSVGAGCFYAGTFIVSETVTKTVLTQNVVDITEKLTFLDNSHNSPAEWGPTSMYYIHTNNESLWTKSPLGGCLNEYDPMGAGGGQIQMKYIYFNGTSVYDINKNDNGSYTSTHPNIVNGSIYAPILVTMSAELGSTLKLTVPTNFTNGKAGHEEIIIKKGFNFVENGTSYYVNNDVVFTKNGATWSTEVKGTEISTEVTGIITKANRTDNGTNENFVIFQLSNNDYAGLNTLAIADISSLYGYIDIDGNVLSAKPGEPFFNVWGTPNSIAFRAPGLDAAGLQQVKYITIKAGAKFPAYTTQNGGSKTYYVTEEDITFIHDVPNDTWTVGTYVAEEIVETSVKAIHTAKGGYIGIELNDHDYAAGKSGVDVSNLVGYISYMDANGTSYEVTNVSAARIYLNNTNFGTSIALQVNGMDQATLETLQSLTIKAGAKFPALSYVNGGNPKYYVTTEDVIIYQHSANNWSLEVPVEPEPEIEATDITNEIIFTHQYTSNNTETYLIKTTNNYWTKAPQGGCLNEHDPDGAGGGQEQMKYIYFNGTSLYDINKNDNESYESTQGNIAGGGIYAPILVTMGTDNGAYSYIQVHVPTAYNNGKAGHESFELKAGFTVEEDGKAWKTTEDLKWVNLNGTWTDSRSLFDASLVDIGNPRMDGDAKELYKVDIVSDAWSITCNDYDFMYGGNYASYRKFIFINGVSVYDINENTDDSAYVYSTFPMTGVDDAIFAKPIIIETHMQDGDNNTITLWIHKDYMATLGANITVTLGAGYKAYTNNSKSLAENVDYSMIAHVTIDGVEQTVIKGSTLKAPEKPMTENTVYKFLGWAKVDSGELLDVNTPITEDVVARYEEITVDLTETQITSIDYYVSAENAEDRWLLFYLSDNDYPAGVVQHDIKAHYDTLVNLGMFDKIIIKGAMTVGGVSKTEATMKEIFDANGYGEAIYINIWQSSLNTLSFRMPGVTLINEIVVEYGCFFPSYRYLEGEVAEDTRYVVMKPQIFTSQSGTGVLATATYDYDISMVDGASIRIKDIPADFDGTPDGTAANNTSGIRFETKITVADLVKLLEKLNSGEYQSVTFGTLIVTTSDLMGGQFTHKWLDANGVQYKDIVSTAGFYMVDGAWTYAFPGSGKDYQSYYGSLVRLKETNYTRWFSGIGYIQIIDRSGDTIYVYADYNSANSRSIAHVAQAAISDRSNTQTATYQYQVGSSYSRYTRGVNNFIQAYMDKYMEDKESMGVAATQLGELKTPVADTVNPTAQATFNLNNKKLKGAYVLLQYSTNVNVRGKFYYNNGAGKTAVEDFYLQAGTTEHKQFLDIYRKNGVGYGFTSDSLYMEKIEFSNVEFDNSIQGDVKILGFYSMDREINVNAQEIYLTVAQDDGSEMTVGAHLGLGGALTYLAKSGIYEGLTGSILSRKVSLKESTGDFSDYYGSGTSSKPEAGAVNLINNFDAGRQIQQSWYAAVGGDTEGNGNGTNGYTRAYCKTESSSGKYWPYNPVQAGDVVSNPSQIIDYEINEQKGYIYVKARAMDWAKGQGTDKLANTIDGGSTTKSYMENYYRLNADGTLYVNNAYVDWNGFTSMETADWASTELPAVYPIQSLNYYVSNLDGDGSWSDGLEYNSGLGSWTKDATRCIQLTTPQPSNGYNNTKVEEWFAWANGGNDSAFAMGVYIPNVDRFTSGRSTASNAQYASGNNDANSNKLQQKGLMSNMQEITKSYQGAYVGNTSYTAPGINFRMEAYKSIDYTYVIALNDVKTIRETFKEIKDNETVTNAGEPNKYEKVGLDAWARADKKWTW